MLLGLLGQAATLSRAPVSKFFNDPILNSPYEYPGKHWELDTSGQPTQRVQESRRIASFLTPIRESKAKGAKLGDIEVQINGVDVFQPSTGEVRSDGADGIACWFIDTDYNEESFFVRQAYFLGANDPYKSLKTTLKAEVDKEAWDSLNSDVSRPFPQPRSGRIAVKVINHLGDEVMKVFQVKEVLE